MRLAAHHQVIVEKLSWIGLVRADPSDPCSQMDDHIGSLIAVELFHRVHLNEIVVVAAGHEEVSAAFRTELFYDERSQKAGSARDDNACHIVIDEILIYRDSHHLSSRGSILFARKFLDFLTRSTGRGSDP